MNPFFLLADDTELEASVPCTKIECLINQYPSHSLDQVQNICNQLLPDHCTDIRTEYTRCNTNNVAGGSLAQFGKASFQSIGTCIVGLADGLIDVLKTIISLGVGSYKFTVDEQYRNEALNSLSILLNDIQGGDALEEFKEILSSSLFEYFDEIASCLNGPGRVHYLCEFLTEVITVLNVVDKAVYPAKVLSNRVKLLKSGNRIRLSPREKLNLRADLKQMLRASNVLPISSVHPYQLRLLSRRQIRQKLKIDVTSRYNLDHLSTRQLRSINLTEVAKINPEIVTPEVISRLSRRQFRAWATPENIGKSPINILESNVSRIDSSLIKNITQIERLDGRFLNSLSSRQLSSMSPAQAYAIREAGKIDSFGRGRRQTVEGKANEHADELRRRSDAENSAPANRSDNSNNRNDSNEGSSSSDSSSSENPAPANRSDSSNNRNDSNEGSSSSDRSNSENSADRSDSSNNRNDSNEGSSSSDSSSSGQGEDGS